MSVKNYWTISRYKEGNSLNPKEYILNDDLTVRKFTKAEAEAFIRDNDLEEIAEAEKE